MMYFYLDQTCNISLWMEISCSRFVQMYILRVNVFFNIQIPSLALNKLRHLSSLNLRANNIAYIPPHAFYGHSLNTLDLSHNLLGKLFLTANQSMFGINGNGIHNQAFFGANVTA